MQLNVKEHILIKTHLKIVNVVDGDGLIVSNLFNKEKEEIRLLGIDAPELKACRKLMQDERETHVAGQLLMELGRIAHKYLINLTPPETSVTLALEKVNHQDIYGRTLAYVFLSDGRCLNELIVADGFSKTYDLVYCNELNNFQRLNTIAKSKKLGLYSIVNRF
jgi:micrococcal nuclease